MKYLIFFCYFQKIKLRYLEYNQIVLYFWLYFDIVNECKHFNQITDFLFETHLPWNWKTYIFTRSLTFKYNNFNQMAWSDVILLFFSCFCFTQKKKPRNPLQSYHVYCVFGVNITIEKLKIDSQIALGCCE